VALVVVVGDEVADADIEFTGQDNVLHRAMPTPDR
jgi:hypothetical protein